jgi:hypothetical protein
MKKISMPNEVGIAIQGPTTFYKEAIKFWNQFDCPMVWATWTDEPIRNVLEIQKSGIDVILLDKPKYVGHLNCNLQFMSSYAGIKRLSELGVEHCLKIRGDCLFFGLEQVWPVDSDISFMFSYNPKYIEENQHLEISGGPFVWPEHCYYLDGILHLGYDWPSDYAIFGKVNTMLDVFNYVQMYPESIPPEALILKQYINLKGLEHNFKHEYLSKNGVHYYGKSLIETNASILNVKYAENMKVVLSQCPGFRMY